MHSISLDGQWSVKPTAYALSGTDGLAELPRAEGDWLAATVPGEIHLDLIRAGQMAEPTVGTNAAQARWPETKAWWYRTTFTVDEAFLAEERQTLVCDGLDLSAQVFVNGQAVGEAANAFVPQVFDVRGRLRAGDNELVIRLTVGSELAQDAWAHPEQALASNQKKVAPGEIPNPPQPGDLTGHRHWGGRKWLRKAQFSYGWDWVEALPNIGVWRSVHVEGRSGVALADLRLDTLLDPDGGVRLELAAALDNLHAWSERPVELVVTLTPPAGRAPLEQRYGVIAQPGRSYVSDVFAVPEPQLWWPNGLGEQPLYGVRAEVRAASGVCDARAFHIGLRTITLDRSPLPEGSRFGVRVNGELVFCHGVNIGPHDALMARMTPEKQNALVTEAQAAHINMIRINGCAIYEDAAFYDACDRAGILVWQDFMLTVANYPANDPAFFAQVQAEAEAIVPILRHHPSLALWCGDNETVWVLAEYGKRYPDTPVNTLGNVFCTEVFPAVCHALDPHRPYWISCPSGGEYPNSELEGDCHWWWPAFMHPDMNRRIAHEIYDECRARFLSEYGILGPCHLDSINDYLPPDERHPGSPSWQLHTNMFEKETVPAAIRRHYAEPEGLSVADYVTYGQMFQALMHGHAMEALRFRKNDPVDDCQGALIWSYSDCWGETGWSILDYYLRRKASYYWFRRACAPVKVIVRRRGAQLVTRLVNDTRAPYAGSVEAGWWAVDGSQRETQTFTLNAEPNSMTEIAADALPSDAERDPRQWVYAAVLRDATGNAVDNSIWTLVPHRALAVPAPDIRVTALPDGGVEVVSPAYCHAVHVEDHGHALLSDNWFDLLPGVPLRLTVAAGMSAPSDFRAVVGEKL